MVYLSNKSLLIFNCVYALLCKCNYFMLLFHICNWVFFSVFIFLANSSFSFFNSSACCLRSVKSLFYVISRRFVALFLVMLILSLDKLRVSFLKFFNLSGFILNFGFLLFLFRFDILVCFVLIETTESVSDR